MKLTIDICDCDKLTACLIRDGLPCPHLTNERPPPPPPDQSEARVWLWVSPSVSAFSWFPAPGNHSPHPLPVQSPLSVSHINTRVKTGAEISSFFKSEKYQYSMGLSYNWWPWWHIPWAAQAVPRHCDILKASWQSDAMPEGPDTLVRSPDLHQEIDNRYVVEKQPRRVSWSPELALGGAGTLNLEPVLSCFERHAVSVWCHHFMARVNQNLDSIFEDYVNMLHPSWR